MFEFNQGHTYINIYHDRVPSSCTDIGEGMGTKRNSKHIFASAIISMNVTIYSVHCI